MYNQRDWAIYSVNVAREVETLPINWSPMPRTHPNGRLKLLDRNDSQPFTDEEKRTLLNLGVRIEPDTNIQGILDNEGWNSPEEGL